MLTSDSVTRLPALGIAFGCGVVATAIRFAWDVRQFRIVARLVIEHQRADVARRLCQDLDRGFWNRWLSPFISKDLLCSLRRLAASETDNL